MPRLLSIVTVILTLHCCTIPVLAAAQPLVLSATGQTTVYAAGDDGTLKKGLAASPRFNVNGDGTVADNLTGLAWSPSFNLIKTDGAFDNDSAINDGAVTWQHALDFVVKLNQMNGGAGYLNHNDWRMPNLNEMRSLLDAAKTAPPLPTGHPFTLVANTSSYWTSSSNRSNPTQAWYVEMAYGNINVTAKSGFSYLVPVRGGLSSYFGVDTTQPETLSFSLPKTWSGLSVPITNLITIDNGDIAGYWFSESPTVPTATEAGWLTYKPTRHTFAGAGVKTLHVFIKDAAGNVSSVASATVTVTAANGYRNAVRNDIPETGQVLSYADGDDGDLQRGVSRPVPRFINETLTTAEDSLTGLVWLKDFNAIPAIEAYATTFDKDGTANDGLVTWQSALDFVAKLNSDSYLGFSDWRLPNLNEMRSLLDASMSSPALPNSHPFARATGNYWTSTSNKGNPTQAWSVEVTYGNITVTAKSGFLHLVPLRGGLSSYVGSDTTSPQIITFALPRSWDSLSVPVLDLSLVDNVAVNGWWLSERATPPKADDAGWLTTSPRTYTFATVGDKTLYAFVKDAAKVSRI
jgi:hypothetical protein